MAKTFIVACDGGGIRGYITASVLQALVGNKGAGNFLPQVSLTAGTSTGSFIALALAAGVTVDKIQTQYQQSNAAPIFTPNPNISSASASVERAAVLRALRTQGAGLGSIWQDLVKYFEYFTNASYTNTGVAQVAQTLLGSNTVLSQLAPVMVTTLQLDSAGGWSPLVITNASGSPYRAMLAYEAALCSGAAPIYFPPFSPSSVSLGFCADGGLFANNPSLAAIVSAIGTGVSPKDLYVLSLDTGTTDDGMSAGFINGFGGPLSMGPVEWLWPVAMTQGDTTTPKFPLLSALMDGASAAIMQQASLLLGSNYFRVKVPLTAPVALDDTSTAAYDIMNASLNAYFDSSAFSSAVNWLKANFPSS